MKTIFLIINVILISFISCSYYSKKLGIHHRNITEAGKMNLLQESTKEVLIAPKENLTSTPTQSEKFSIIKLQNRHDVQYYGDIYMGIPKTKLSVIFDTWSNILWVPSSQCQTCRINSVKYNPALSKTAEKKNKLKSISFAVGYVEGDLYSERVSLNSPNSFLPLNNEIYAEKFNFLSVNKEINLTGTSSDGVMGLGVYNEGDPYNSFIETLYNQKQINAPAFSFYILGVKNISRLYIGDILNNAYIAKLLKNNKQECLVDSNALYWECYPYNGIKITNKNNDKNKIFNTSSTMIFDTGSSYTLIPKSDFMTIINFLNLEHNCIISNNNQLLCKCQSKDEFGKIEINFNENNKFMLDLNNMIEFYKDSIYQCHFQINMEIYDLNTWVLGDSSLRRDIISFNIYERKVTFVQNISGIIEDNKIAQNKWIDKGGSLLYSLIFWIIIIATIGLLILFILYLIR